MSPVEGAGLSPRREGASRLRTTRFAFRGIALGLAVLLSVTAFAAAPAGARVSGVSAPVSQASGPSPQPATTILTGSYGRILADPVRNRMYFSRPAWGAVLVWNTTSNAQLANVSVGSAPLAMDLSWSGNELYVGLTGSASLAVVDLVNLTLEKTVYLGVTPYDVAGGRPGRVYVSTTGYWDYPRIVDVNRGVVIGQITGAGTIYQDALVRTSLDRSLLFVAETGLSPAFVFEFNVSTDAAPLISQPAFDTVGENLQDLQVSPNHPWLLIASGWPYYVQKVSYLNWSSLGSLSTGPYPSSVGLAGRGTIAFADHESSDVIAFNVTTGASLGTFTFSQQAATVRASHDGTAVYAITTDIYGGSVQVERIATGLAAISNEPVRAFALALPPYGYSPTAVALYGGAAFGALPYKFSWDFGDGTTGTGWNVSHSFTATGLHNVTLTVTDGKGWKSTTRTSVYVLTPPLPSPLQIGPTIYGAAFSFATDPYVPPDPQVAVGPNHIVEMVNLQMLVWDRSENLVLSEPLSSFFRKPAGSWISDPRVVYDASSGRWFASILDINDSAVLLMVSPGSDPTASWYQVPLTVVGCPDQPMLGVGPQTVVVSGNVFSSCTSATYTYEGAEYWVVNKTDLLAARYPGIYASGALAGTHSLHPVTVLDATGTMYLVSVGWAIAPTTAVQVIPITGSPPTVSPGTPLVLPIRVVNQPPNVAQMGSSFQVNTGDSRVLDALERNGRLWITFGDACSPAGPSTNQSCARILEVDPANHTVVQDFDIGDAVRGYFYPAIRFDGAGDLIVTFGYASSSDFPGMMATVQVVGDASNTARAVQIVVQGTGPEALWCPDGVSCRFGDYFGASPDPFDPEAVWIAGEIGGSTGWQTGIASVGIFTPMDLNLRYTTIGPGTPTTPPSVSYFHQGRRVTSYLYSYNQTYPADPGTPWSVSTSVLGSTSRERWSATGTTSGTATAPLNLTIPYQEQFYAQFTSASPGVGTVSPGPGWYDAGSAVHLSVTSSPGWLFAGWTGSGAGSISSATANVTVTVNGPIDETAAFNPGLGLVAGPGGAIAYRYGNVSGVVAAGSAATLSIPRNTWVNLSVVPESGWAFGGWTGSGYGNVSGAASAQILILANPIVERASFDPGLTITASVGGDVAYHSGNVSGQVSAGTSKTLYVAWGSSVDLTAEPASGQSFLGWSGNASGGTAAVTVTVSGPTSASASFGTPTGALVTSVVLPLLAIVLVAVAVAFLVLRRRKRKQQAAGPAPPQAPSPVPPPSPSSPPAGGPAPPPPPA